MEIRYDQLLAFLFLLSRCSGIFVVAPFLGNFNVPVQVRVLLSVAISYLFALSFQLPEPAVPWTLTYILLGLAGELIVGMAIGFAAQVLFAGLECAGQIIGFQMGLSLVNTVDPETSNRSTTLSAYQSQLGLMLFLGINGHHWFIQAIAESFRVLPPYSMGISQQFISKLTDLAAQIFVIGFQIAAPVTAVLILTDIALGFIGRSAPQIHILVIGFPLKILAGISALGLVLYFFPAAMRMYSLRLQHDLGIVIQLLRI
jgi:flagellar biosynthetic protein FliR